MNIKIRLNLVHHTFIEIESEHQEKFDCPYQSDRQPVTYTNLKHLELYYEVRGNPDDPAIIMIMGFGARGYFVSTVGRDKDVIREYIKNQEKADRELDIYQERLI